ncbi:MAG: aroE [Alphaproteobacteria bacterium]|nr:aroE [Alphaproteobacteria bacterium]
MAASRTAPSYAEVIGDPISHSKSPLIHKFWLSRLGLEGDYRATRVPPDGLEAFFAERRADPAWRGCNVTVPHKQTVMASLDRLSEGAQAVGAVNTIVAVQGALAGDNSDVGGIIDALSILPARATRVCLIGSGGAALAALAAFRLLAVSHVALNVRDQAKGERLLAESGLDGRVGAVDDRDGLLGAELIVNATTLGMSGQAAMPEAVLRHVAAIADPGVAVFDMVYAPLETALLVAARKRGLRAIDGLEMLVGQAALAFALLFGCAPPRAYDAELRALLTS